MFSCVGLCLCIARTQTPHKSPHTVIWHRFQTWTGDISFDMANTNMNAKCSQNDLWIKEVYRRKDGCDMQIAPLLQGRRSDFKPSCRRAASRVQPEWAELKDCVLFYFWWFLRHVQPSSICNNSKAKHHDIHSQTLWLLRFFSIDSGGLIHKSSMRATRSRVSVVGLVFLVIIRCIV